MKKAKEKKDRKIEKEAKILNLLTKSVCKILTKIILILALLAALFFGGKFSWQKLGEIKTEKSSAIVFRELEKCAELVTVKNTYSDIISIKKTRIAGFAKTFSIVKYSGVIRGGISDISKSQVKVSDRGRSVKVILPALEVLSNDISSIEVFDESKSIFVSISIKEIMEEIRHNQDTASIQILETGFLKEGESQTIKIIESILYAAGFKEVEVRFQR
ncbi:DUF4230 domain-containing protein [Treponema ruminis]|uniref:DUF4230 domain-containing protein n=1 Tax=Treponema ruminis TaxID=744515 RepID=A0A7W8G9P4_9SPIR|nr:DUF4230 domain-containing protein [Treponema ruminis]MBB5226395.1 hypothetical protein [Treponema ruminis]QSI02700.1 DUF4230 domain-containing protein [Treponema ruminis]